MNDHAVISAFLLVLTMTDRDPKFDWRMALGAAMEAGFDGYLPRLERARMVLDRPAVESVVLDEASGRATVTRIVPFSEVPTLLSPLTLEMVERIGNEVWAEFKGRADLSVEARDAAIAAIERMEDRLRQRMGGERE